MLDLQSCVHLYGNLQIHLKERITYVVLWSTQLTLQISTIFRKVCESIGVQDLELRWVHLVKLVADGSLHGQLYSRR